MNYRPRIHGLAHPSNQISQILIATAQKPLVDPYSVPPRISKQLMIKRVKVPTNNDPQNCGVEWQFFWLLGVCQGFTIREWKRIELSKIMTDPVFPEALSEDRSINYGLPSHNNPGSSSSLTGKSSSNGVQDPGFTVGLGWWFDKYDILCEFYASCFCQTCLTTSYSYNQLSMYMYIRYIVYMIYCLYDVLSI